jgi:hypothetical protein
MNYTAYAVLFVRKGSPSTVVGVGIFSEHNPTTEGAIPVVLFHEDAETFEKAKELCENRLAHREYDWAGELQTSRWRGTFRMAPTPKPAGHLERVIARLRSDRNTLLDENRRLGELDEFYAATRGHTEGSPLDVFDQLVKTEAKLEAVRVAIRKIRETAGSGGREVLEKIERVLSESS